MARILVVEDSSAVRTYIRMALEQAPDLFGDGSGDVEVIETASGFDALRLLPRGSYDLVITDINMPDINGLELVRFIRESDRYRSVCTIVISSQSSEKDRARCMTLGAQAFLAKPFTVETLHQTIRTALGARSASAAGDCMQPRVGASSEGSL